MSIDLKIVLSKTKLFATGYFNLFFHEVDTRDHFRYRVFNLQSGIHFKEVEI